MPACEGVKETALDRMAAVFRIPECLITLRVTLENETNFRVSVMATVSESDRQPYAYLKDGSKMADILRTIAEGAASGLKDNISSVSIDPDGEGKAYGSFTPIEPINSPVSAMALMTSYFTAFARILAGTFSPHAIPS